MTVTISIKDVLYEMESISHLEVANIENVEERYLAEAGTEKEEESKRCIFNAEADMRLQMDRFLESLERVPDENQTEQFVFKFIPSRRIQEHREDIFSQLIKAAMVSLSLAQFYVSVGRNELAEKHTNMANSNLLTLEKMYFEKKPPYRPEE